MTEQTQPEPTRYYKYMSREVGRIVLTNRTLRWSTPGTLNDPHDMQFDLLTDIDAETLSSQIIDKMWADYSAPVLRPAGNELGAGLGLLRAMAPGLSREQFEEHFGETVAGGLAQWHQRVIDLQAEMRPLMQLTKVLCLTLVPDNELMWAH